MEEKFTSSHPTLVWVTARTAATWNMATNRIDFHINQGGERQWMNPWYDSRSLATFSCWILLYFACFFFSTTVSVLRDAHCDTRNNTGVRVELFARLSATLLLHLRGRRTAWKTLQKTCKTGWETGSGDSAAAPSFFCWHCGLCCKHLFHYESLRGAEVIQVTKLSSQMKWCRRKPWKLEKS